jgi:cytochrome oxidase Cu insertion factor (SCO1/SenC/PrrC family)
MAYPKKQLILVTLFAGAVGLFAGFVRYQSAPGKNARPPDIPGFLWPNPKPLSAFSLDAHGPERFDLDSLKGKWTFLFFGYIHCPEVCPVALSVLADVERRLSEAGQPAENTQVVFVSLDPQRDSPEQLRHYAQHFSPDFLGVTGNDEQLAGLTRQLGILYRMTDRGPTGDYLVDHTASVLLTDPEARLVAVFGFPHNAESIANRFMTIRDFLEG